MNNERLIKSDKEKSELDLLLLEREECSLEISSLEREVADLMTQIQALESKSEMEAMQVATKIVSEAAEALEQENENAITETVLEITDPTKLEDIKKEPKKNKKFLKAFKKIARYVVLGAISLTADLLNYYSPADVHEMWRNWSERHIGEKTRADDPRIKGVEFSKYLEALKVERTTYDFLGPEKIDYKFGSYQTSVFDLTDRTPPKFELINSWGPNRTFSKSIDNALAITASAFHKFYTRSEFIKETATGIETQEEILNIPVIAYSIKEKTIRVGSVGDFDDNWLLSRTSKFSFDWELNSDGTINLAWNSNIKRAVPVLRTADGQTEEAFTIGVSHDRELKKIRPEDATSFGVLDGGKIILACGEKQVQVNGSFADMYAVYKRLKQEYPNTPIYGYALDNGSYNLPIWLKNPGTLTPDMVNRHLKRNNQGGFALVLLDDESVSPYEYKNKYKEIEHFTSQYEKHGSTQEPIKNECSAVVIHHTGEYDMNSIISTFEDEKQKKSAHVVIDKDGTRHIFNNDRFVLAHAGKSEFMGREQVNFFSLGVELQGDTSKGQYFTIAQIESLIEYLRPRVEKYNISLDDITTHKIIRENYKKKYPEEKGVHHKNDLDGEVWVELKQLIAKKLYGSRTDFQSLGIHGYQMLGALTYKEILRVTKNKEAALAGAALALTENGMGQKDAETVVKWIANKVT